MISNKEGKAAEQAKAHLRSMLKPGDTVYTILNHCSTSGMSRSISIAIVQDQRIVKLDYWVAKAMGDHIDSKRGGLKVSGCGMGFHLVYNLGRLAPTSRTNRVTVRRIAMADTRLNKHGFKSVHQFNKQLT